MNDLTVREMLAMQEKLQAQYKDKWEPIGVGTGKNKLLWMICEIGEVIDIIKKHDEQKLMEEGELRRDLVEELADVLMYYHDVMLCYGITADELKQVYVEKFERNMSRW